MKIENNGLSPLSSNKAESSQRLEKKYRTEDVHPMGGEKDKAVLSESARLLAKARTAMDKTADKSSEKVESLRAQVESGNYAIQVEEIAKKLIPHLYPKG